MNSLFEGYARYEVQYWASYFVLFVLIWVMLVLSFTECKSQGKNDDDDDDDDVSNINNKHCYKTGFTICYILYWIFMVITITLFNMIPNKKYKIPGFSDLNLGFSWIFWIFGLFVSSFGAAKIL